MSISSIPSVPLGIVAEISAIFLLYSSAFIVWFPNAEVNPVSVFPSAAEVMFNCFCCSLVKAIVSGPRITPPLPPPTTCLVFLTPPSNALLNPSVVSFANLIAAAFPSSVDKSSCLNFKETSVLPASSPKASIYVFTASFENPWPPRSNAIALKAICASDTVAFLIARISFLYLSKNSLLPLNSSTAVCSVALSWLALTLAPDPALAVGVWPNKPPKSLTLSVVIVIASARPSVAILSFSLDLLYKSKALFANNKPDITSPTGPKNLAIIFPKDNRFGSNFLIPPENIWALSPIFLVARFPAINPTLTALSYASFAIWVCVKSWVTDIKPNNKPEYFITCEERLPMAPPAIVPAPASEVSANVPLISALFIFDNLSEDCFILFSCCCPAANTCGLAGIVSWIFDNFTDGAGWPGALNGISLTPPTAELAKVVPALATSSCLLFIPSSRPRPISSPIFLVFFDGDAVPAAVAVALTAAVPILTPTFAASAVNSAVNAFMSFFNSANLIFASSDIFLNIFAAWSPVNCNSCNASGLILNSELRLYGMFAEPAVSIILCLYDGLPFLDFFFST